MIPDGRILTTLAMLGLFGAAIGLALALPSKAAFMPLLIGVPGFVLCAVQLVLDIRKRRATPAGAAPPQDAGRSEVEVFVWLGLFSLALLGFGFVLGGPIVVAAFVRFSSRESRFNALVAGLGTLAVLWGVFIWLLELSLFRGLVIEALV